ncbi:putative membrane protein [Rubidibacter lacunae KORDI 51-2]|uniref:Putative membrane protein n=1 Tax=Rubidibacter lacunae KORDI 51-2 TaxID=582515 RepID=U5DJN8_9CHRO|nr:DUF1269 domain-containing protein [Rubidibacter lacunae]ERN41107.1 putative membrane protein [Rubidibacter lacunae KORDI 51-2]
MADLTVWKFDTPNGAEQALSKLAELQKQHLIKISDAAIVSWKSGKRKPKTRQAVNLVGISALDGAFWGLLFGILFFVPIFGLVIGTAMGMFSGSLADYGIDDDFINEVRSKVTEGTSALFLLTTEVTIDKVQAAFTGQKMELIQSNLSTEQETSLRDHFQHEEVMA